MPKFRHAAVAAFVLGALLGVAPAAQAEMIKLAATLSGKNEVPPVQTAATGSAEMTLDTATHTLSWTVTFQGLSAELRAAHFHGQASVTENAPIVVPIAKRGDASPVKGSKVLTPEQAEALLAGRWYINVHTATHPPGEIRGQVVRQ
jgi:hypothetical protein